MAVTDKILLYNLHLEKSLKVTNSPFYPNIAPELSYNEVNGSYFPTASDFPGPLNS